MGEDGIFSLPLNGDILAGLSYLKATSMLRKFRYMNGYPSIELPKFLMLDAEIEISSFLGS